MLFKNFINEYKNEYIRALEKLDNLEIEKVTSILEETLKNEKNVFVVGNGGSSASASHWVCDFNKGVSFDNRELVGRFYSLTDNTPIVTAYANDISYEDIFVEQLKNLANLDDILVLLSVSGNSKNLMKAQLYANEKGLMTISITNCKDNELKKDSRLAISVPSENYGIVEDIHMYVCHVISQYLAKKY